MEVVFEVWGGIGKVGKTIGFGGKARGSMLKWYRGRPFLGNIIHMNM
jgi:hypothetical protein